MIYIVSLKATDYANRTTTQSSPPIIIDTTPPIKTDKPVTIPGRHITSDTEIEAWLRDIITIDLSVLFHLIERWILFTFYSKFL